MPAFPFFSAVTTAQKKTHYLKIALTVFIAQLAFILLVTLFHWQNLCRWDGEWYAHIVDHGYVSELPPSVQIKDKGNVAFFPVYPLLSGAVKAATGLSTESSLILTAELFAIGVWFYFLLFLSLWNDPLLSADERERTLRERLLLFALYPYSFFLMVSYSESVFLFFLFGFLYAVERWVRADKRDEKILFYWLAALQGMALTGTRLVGVFLIVYPMIRVFLNNRFSWSLLKAGALTLLASAGAGLFFLYCYFHFGQWDLYFTTVKIGWNEYTDWHELFPPRGLYEIEWNHVLKSDNIGRLLTIAVIGFQFFQFAKLWREKNTQDGKFALLLLSIVTLGGTLYGRSSYRFAGFGRYLLPVVGLLLPWVKLPKLKKNVLTYLLIFILIAFQFFFVAMFARRGWVA